MIRINYQLNVQVAGGPKASYAGSLQVEAYDVINVAVPPATDDLEIQLQPGTASEQVTFLMITSDRFADLSYKVNDAAATEVYALNAPQLLIGSGAVSLLDEVPQPLVISNAHGTEAANINILVGRDATPAP
ncbi:hypothetical protein BH23GEM7_BH23GEM7_23910 [soil metagenome]|nr:hypothetical protein [Gemmatimonadota bacterium]